MESDGSHTKKTKLNCLIALTKIDLLISYHNKLEKVGNIIKIRLFQCPSQGLTILMCFLSFFDIFA